MIISMLYYETFAHSISCCNMSPYTYGQSSSKNLLWVCEKNAKLIAVLELFEYVMRW